MFHLPEGHPIVDRAVVPGILHPGQLKWSRLFSVLQYPHICNFPLQVDDIVDLVLDDPGIVLHVHS